MNNQSQFTNYTNGLSSNLSGMYNTVSNAVSSDLSTVNTDLQKAVVGFKMPTWGWWVLGLGAASLLYLEFKDTKLNVWKFRKIKGYKTRGLSRKQRKEYDRIGKKYPSLNRK